MNEAGAISKEPKTILKNPRNVLDPLSLRTEQAVAKFGKAARHPLCLAGLSLWAWEVESSKLSKDAESMNECLKGWELHKKKARALYEQFHKEEKQKELIEAAALLQKINEHLPELRKAYQAQINLVSWRREMRTHFGEQFEHEKLAAETAKNTSALRALPRVHKRWKALSTGARLKHSELRELGILQLLRAKKIRAEQAKGGATAGYWEAVQGDLRPVSDGEWQGRLTAREIHSHLTATDGPAVAGDKEAKEVRRTARRLKIQLDEDQVGRKWKEPAPPKRQKPKRPLGRPRTKIELVTTPDIDQALAELFQRSCGKPRQPSNNQFWDSAEARRTAIQKRLMKLKKQSKKRRRSVCKGLEKP